MTTLDHGDDGVERSFMRGAAKALGNKKVFEAWLELNPTIRDALAATPPVLPMFIGHYRADEAARLCREQHDQCKTDPVLRIENAKRYKAYRMISRIARGQFNPQAV